MTQYTNIDSLELKGDQPSAWLATTKWLESSDSDPFFILRGYAGSGKSYLTKSLKLLPYNFVFCAPTNKAAAVLSDFLGEPVRTVYSVLGLRLEFEEDKKVLVESSFRKYFGENTILVVDEASMLARELVLRIRKLCCTTSLRAIFIGDPAQLNPVGEDHSSVWDYRSDEDQNHVLMKSVLRYDSGILNLATGLRNSLRDNDFNLKLKTELDDFGKGVHVLLRKDFDARMLKNIDWDKTRVLAWRNKTVDRYNNIIRRALGRHDEFMENDRIVLTAPFVVGDEIWAHTDEEFSVQNKSVSSYQNIPTWNIQVKEKSFTFRVPQDAAKLQTQLNRIAENASQASGTLRRSLWKEFWSLKDSFQMLRYGHALTCHRAQGSTYENVFVDAADILVNENEIEAYRCLYVAVTRPTSNVFTY